MTPEAQDWVTRYGVHLGAERRLSPHTRSNYLRDESLAIYELSRTLYETLSQELTGIVSAIGLKIGRQSITSEDPAVNTDARVVDVIVTLDAASSERTSGLTNLETVVRIDAGRPE